MLLLEAVELDSVGEENTGILHTDEEITGILVWAGLQWDPRPIW